MSAHRGKKLRVFANNPIFTTIYGHFATPRTYNKTMTLKVVPANEADAPRIVAIEQVAFGPNPISSALYPGPFPEGNVHLEAKNINELRASPHCRWMKVVDEELEAKGEESTIAMAAWYFWDVPLTHAMLPPDGQYGPGANQECCELFFGGMKRNMIKWFEGKTVARKYFFVPFP